MSEPWYSEYPDSDTIYNNNNRGYARRIVEGVTGVAGWSVIVACIYVTLIFKKKKP